MAFPKGVLFVEPQNKPLSTAGLPQANCFRVFYVTGTTTLATVYQDGALTTPFSQSPTPITADGSGRFPPIYLDPGLVYRCQLYAAGATIGVSTPLEDVDPFVAAPFTPMFAVKATSTNRANNSTLAADPHLQLSLPGAGTYEFECLIEVTTPGSTGATPGLKAQINFSGSLSAGFASSIPYVGNMNGSVGNATAINTTVNFSLTGASALNAILLRGVITATTAGTLELQWAQQNSNASATIVAAGCYLAAQQIG